MDKNSIKKYAVWARRELISRVSQRALLYGISEKDCGDMTADTVNGHLLTASEKRQRQSLIAKIKKDGYQQAMEAAAYTWFNRFSALRFMEVNGYLPSHVRVFTDEDNNFKPQILAEAIHLDIDGLDMEKVYAMKDANKTDELYKYLLITQCNALGAVLPGMFTRIEDYTELLFPDNLLREGSVIEQMIAQIPADNFDVSSENGQLEIIGWLYQYYISEKHEEVVDPLHGKVVKKEEVPAATQLFTTDWVVRYIIDNSVGRYWIERNPNSTLKNELRYFVTPKDGNIPTVNEAIKPQDVTVLDPCVGSGHFLVYAFEVLLKIYVEYGYSEREAASEIVAHNLFGLDIDERAVQLAYFAVMMKARQYDRRFLTRGVKPHLFAIEESNDIDSNSIDFFCGNDVSIKHDVSALIDTFRDAKEYGSILQMPSLNFDKLYQRLNSAKEEISLFGNVAVAQLQSLIDVAYILSKKYATVATNPPYLNKYDDKLKNYIFTTFDDYKGDLFSVFIYHNFQLCINGGYCGFMTPFVWMFIKTYEPLRNYIINNKAITTLIQMEYSAFEEATVPICTFVLQNSKAVTAGLYFKLSEFKGGMEVQRLKVLEAVSNKECGYFYESPQDCYLRVPNAPIAFSVSEAFFEIFSNKKIGDFGEAREGMATANNDLFLRYWFEVSNNRIGFNLDSRKSAADSLYRWFPYNKGGDYRKWYGNNDYVVNWENDGFEIQHFADPKTGRIRSHNYNLDYIFSEGITWTALSSGNFGCRYSKEGFLADSKGSMLYMFKKEDVKYILALLNSSVSKYVLGVTSQTLDFKPGRISEIPVVILGKNEIVELSNRIIDYSKSEWDSFETSWDFNRHPLICGARTVSEAYAKWEAECDDRFNQLKANEEELNRIFIDIYGLQDELTPEVEDKDVTVRKADLQRDIKSLISYAVGCMFGRYSLDVDGLAYAGGDWDVSKYTTFPADKDNIIPICDDEYFDDDIVARFVQFIETVYGKDTLEENLRFIADALGGKGASRDVIRDYFLNGFYADHLKIYQKRPIYWLFDSGKKGGFKALIYMHRYQPDTIARIRTDYVHEQQARYRTAIADLENRITGASTSERVKLNKLLQKLQAQADEIRAYEEKIHHLADQMIRIDLDDGVKVNYAKFEDVLAKIK